MKKILCIMLILCFFLVGFTVGQRSVGIRLEEYEAVYIYRWGREVYVWQYIYDADTLTWDMKQVKDLPAGLDRINIQFGRLRLF